MLLRKKNYIIMMMMMSILLIAVFSSGCIGETVAQSEPTNHLNYQLSALPHSLDPAHLQDEAGYEFWLNLFEGLVRLQPDGTLAKGMAEDWQVVNEGEKYLFTLRESAVWSDGQKVTASDFVSAVKRNLAPSIECPYAYLLYDIKNAKNYNQSLKKDYFGPKVSEADVGIWAEDERTLVIELEQRNPAFIKKLIHPVAFPLPPQAFLSENADFFTLDNLVGNGPFRLLQTETEGTEETESEGTKSEVLDLNGIELEGAYVLVKNDSYWDKAAVKLESMAWFLPQKELTGWQLFQEKKIALTADIPFSEIAPGLKKGNLQKSPILATYFYHFNVTQKPLADLRVRQALSFALEREKIVEEVLRGGQEVARGLVPQGMPDNTPGSDFSQNRRIKIPDNDLKEAQRLLAEAGYPNGDKFPEIELLVRDSGGHQYLAEKVKEQWEAKLGISVKVTAVNWQELVARMGERNYDIGLLGWAADYLDPAAFLNYYVTGSGNNDTGWFNEEYDRLLKELSNSDDEPTRMQVFHQAEEILLTELPLLPLYEYSKIFAAREKIEGLFFSPLGHGFDFKWTSLN